MAATLQSSAIHEAFSAFEAPCEASIALSILLTTAGVTFKRACGWLLRSLRLLQLGGDCTKGHDDPPEPPEIPGSILFGNGPQFRANAVEFLLSCRQRFGDLFCIRFPGGHRIHVLMDPHSVSEFGRTRSLDFGPIHEQVTRNVFGFSMPDAHRMLKGAAKSARAGLKDDIGRYAAFVEESLDAKANVGGSASEWQRELLDDFLGDTQFRAIFNCIFGRSDGTAFNHANARRLFADIHASFNYVWLGFPTWLFPRTWLAWRQVRQAHPSPLELVNREDCSAYIRSVMQVMLSGGQSHASMVGHNLVYLHVNYNTKKATYWAVRNLLAHPEALKALRDEVDAEVDGRIHGAADSVAEFTAEDVERLPILDSLVKETFRLSSGVFMIRQVMEDTVLQLPGGGCFSLRRGDKAAVYPPALHRDPEVFNEPNEFKIDRFVDSNFEFRCRPVTRPILPYGLLCPGQRLSLAQIKWFLFALVARFDLRSDGALAEYDFGSYGHEILPPVHDMAFCYAQRQSRPQVRLVLS